MACKRSAVRSRLAPPRFALRATRGAATQDRRTKRARHSPQGHDGLATPPDIIHHYRVYFLRATRGAATQDRRAKRARHSPQGDDGLETQSSIIIISFGLRVAQPRKTEGRSVPGIARRATTGWRRNLPLLLFPSGYAWRSHARPKGEACPA